MPIPPAGFPAVFASVARETHVYLVRHGESAANAEGRIQGRTEYPLTERGRAQAAACGDWLAGRPVASVLCSPFSRAAETAAIVAARAGFPAPEPLDLLMEIDTGAFSGLTLDEARDRHPAAYRRFESESWEAVPGAERKGEVAARALAAWARLAAAAKSGDVVAVTHGGLIQWLFRTSFGHGEWMPLVTTGNCGVFHFVAMPTVDGGAPYLQWREIDRVVDPSIGSTPPVF